MNGADLRTTDSTGNTLLHIAADYGQLEVVKYLLSKGVDINSISKIGATPLDMAIYQNRQEVTNYLREHGAISILKMREKAEAPQMKEFHITLNTSSTAYVEALMYRKKDPENTKYTAIFIATLSGELNQVKMIFAHTNSCDANTTDEEGRTPIFWACKYGYLDIVKYLIDKGANIEHISNTGSNPIRYACANGKLEVVKYAFEELGSDDKNVTTDGWTYLHSACQADQVDLVKYLIQRGADMAAKQTTGSTPMHVACDNKSFNVLKYLLETYPSVYDVNDKDSKGQTPIVYAVSTNDLEMVKYLVERGGDVNVKFGCNYTVLHYCAEKKFNDLGKFLISSGADIYATVTRGFTPFALAAVDDNLELVQHFLSIGSISDLSCGTLHDI